MLTDYFVRLVALDELRSGIPGQNISLRVEHEDRVVSYAFDQQAKRRLARVERSFLFLASTGLGHHSITLLHAAVGVRHPENSRRSVGFVLR
ncbi:MAG TPA: hypothetical protein VGK44_19200 [Casimicrobiaceae bacterium]